MKDIINMGWRLARMMRVTFKVNEVGDGYLNVDWDKYEFEICPPLGAGAGRPTGKLALERRDAVEGMRRRKRSGRTDTNRPVLWQNC